MKCPDHRTSEQIEYEFVAAQISREDGLVNNRMTWVLQLNGFLFAALALVAKEDVDQPYQTFFSVAVPVIAIVVGLSGLVGIRAAQLRSAN